MQSRMINHRLGFIVLFGLVLLVACSACSACSGDRSSPHAALHCPPGTQRAGTQQICIVDLCGNGIVDPGEACDDGNQIAGDGCSSDCRSTEACGNGIVDVTVGELCDDGNTLDGDSCCADCRSCPELAVDFRALARTASTDPPSPAEPACDPAELQRALADLHAAASSRADHAMAQASPPIAEARAGTRRATQSLPPQPDTDDARQRVQELTQRNADLAQRNADLLARLRAVQERLALLEGRPPNGRSQNLN